MDPAEKPNFENLITGVNLPRPLGNILRNHSEASGIPFNTLGRHYILLGLEADGVEFSDADKRAIEEDITRLQDENPGKETFEDLIP